MTTPTDNKNFVDCGNCAMDPVCQSIEVDNQSLLMSPHYLSRRVVTNASYAIFKQNDPLSAIYAVSSGTYKLCIYIQNTQTAQIEEKIIGFRFPGELLGEDGLHLKQYNYSAIAITQSSVCIVSIDNLVSCGKLVPQLQENLIKLINQQSYICQKNFQAFIGKKSAESLLASFLINSMERNAAHSGSETVLNLSISRNDIANFLGLRRETLSRIFSKFQKDQLIKVESKKIILNCLDKLHLLVN